MFFCPCHPDGQKHGRRSGWLFRNADGSAIVGCFAGCDPQDILWTLGFSLSSSRQEQREPEVVYDYRDKDGKLLYQVVRFPGKDFKQRRPDGTGGWIYNLQGVERTLYRLPEVLGAVQKGEPVYVVEGERDADNLARLGLAATTNSGGAGKWQDSFADHLAGADVVILPDNDNPGRKHAEQVARSLQGKAKCVKILELPGLPPKGDVSDWLAASGTKEELLRLAAEAPEWEPPREPEPAQEPEYGAEKKPKKSDVLIACAAEAKLFKDQNEDAFAVVPVAGHQEIHPVESRAFRRWLAYQYYQIEGEGPGRDAINEALETIAARAIFEGKQHNLYLRAAWHDGALWYDLADSEWRAVRISPAGWEIVQHPPILFRRYQNTAPQVEPQHPGNLALLGKYINLDENGRLLFRVEAISALVASIPHVIPIVAAEKGAGKSTLLRIRRRLVDPARQELVTLPNDKNELALMLAHNYAPTFDNLSSLQGWQSDMLCTASTGGGISKRQLYTDSDEVFLSFQHCPALNGINVVATAPDLLDRALILHMERIDDGKRQRECEFWTSFEADRPYILAGMLDVLAGALRIYPDVRLHELPRMADFACWGYAIAEAVGLGGDRFMAAYAENQRAANNEAISGNPVAAAMQAFVENRTWSTWTGTPAQLLEALERVAEAERIDIRGKGWPKAANSLTRKLKGLKSNLLDVGIQINENRTTGGRREIIISKRSTEKTATCVTTVNNQKTQGFQSDGFSDDINNLDSNTVTLSSLPEALSDKESDAGDAGDDILGISTGAEEDLLEVRI